MSIQHDADGRRSVAVEVEVPGTPEQVWAAIATGPGVSAWFVPTEIEGREGGRVVSSFGPGMDAVATIQEWQPPHRFTAESETGLGPGAPPIATEWVVEARGDGLCTVRVVNSLFTSSDAWDDQLKSVEGGWPGFFHILGLYLRHFPGLPNAYVGAMAFASTPEAAAWQTLLAPLGLQGVEVGRPFAATGATAPLAGTVEQIGLGKYPHVLVVLLDAPAPGIGVLSANSAGPRVYISVTLHLFGERAATVAANDQPTWQSWLKELFS